MPCVYHAVQAKVSFPIGYSARGLIVRRQGRWSFNDHLIKCCKRSQEKKKMERLKTQPYLRPMEVSSKTLSRLRVEAKENRLQQGGSHQCRWQGCTESFTFQSMITVASHVSHHVHRSRSYRCLWSGCWTTTANHIDLSTHMLQSHGMISEYTLDSKAHYCYECAEWFESDFEWDTHCEKHVRDVKDLFCGAVKRHGITSTAALCPFCLGSSGMPSHRYRQFPEGGLSLKEHIHNHHLRYICEPFTCPHPLCKKEIKSIDELFKHLTETHGILFGTQKEEEDIDIV